MQKLLRNFYQQDTITVAQALLGKYLVRETQEGKQIGRIVEVEAYLGEQDLAAHSSRGITKRTQVMFGEAGHAYVYLIYGIYHCVNVVTEHVGVGTAILLRALEPIENITLRTQGPGLLCRAMNIDKSFNGFDLTDDNFYIAQPNNEPPIEIVAKARIGVAYAKEWAQKPLRFYIKGNQFVSKP